MDGYIKNKKEAIAAVGRTIFAKYSVTVFILALIAVWLFAIALNQPPEKWTHTEIVFSSVSQEQIGLQRGLSDVLNDQNGRQYVISSEMAALDALVPGKSYCVVFSNTITGTRYIRALSDEDRVFQDLNHSVLWWESEQRAGMIAVFVSLCMEIVALILIDRLWCRKEYARIRKLKEDIARRECRVLR